MSKLIQTEKELDAMLKSHKKLMLLFYASWCPFCSRFLPIFEKHCGQEGFARVMIDDMDACEEKYSIEVVPTVLYFENGKVAKRLDGAPGVGLTEKQLLEMVKTCDVK